METISKPSSLGSVVVLIQTKTGQQISIHLTNAVLTEDDHKKWITGKSFDIFG